MPFNVEVVGSRCSQLFDLRTAGITHNRIRLRRWHRTKLLASQRIRSHTALSPKYRTRAARSWEDGKVQEQMKQEEFRRMLCCQDVIFATTVRTCS
jgi:hypothetical protein